MTEKFTPLNEPANPESSEKPLPGVAEDLEALHRLIADCHQGTLTGKESDLFSFHARNPAFAYDVEIYRAGVYPNLTELEHSFGVVIQYLETARSESVDREECELLDREQKFFSGRIALFKQAASAYADSVAQFQRLARPSFTLRSDPETVRDSFIRADATRRRRHDALFDSLTATYTHLSRLVTDGYIPQSKVQVWDRSVMTSRLNEHDTKLIDSPVEQISTGSITVIGPSVLDKQNRDDRSLVQQWALAIDITEIEKELAQLSANAENGMGK
jgi:hypothetical protein